MKTLAFADAPRFLDAVGSQLATDEVRYGLLLGLSMRLVREPRAYGAEDPWFGAVEDKGRLCAAAMRTPPHKLLLAQFTGDAEAIAGHLLGTVAARWDRLPGVVGDQAIADCFAAQWCRARGVFVKVRMAQRIYRLDQVADVPLASGRLRLAQPGDEELVAAWGRGYHEEIYGAAGAEEPATDFRGKLRRQEVFVWEDPTPVSMASKARPTPNGISLLGVYTPPARRRRGYATACVAALCGHLLQAGYRFCVLYTDLANPTSNSIYQRIGFRPACDSADNVFGG